MQNVMTAYLAVMILIPSILLIFSLVSFTQEGQIRDVSVIMASNSYELQSRQPLLSRVIRGLAIAEKPREALYKLKSCQVLRNLLKIALAKACIR